MKKSLFIFALLLSLYSCGSNNEIDVPLEPEFPKEYLLSFGFSGEIINIEESPLNRSTTSDVYGMQVYYAVPNEELYRPYAYGLFSDKTNMQIKLLEGYKYKFACTMVVDGANKLVSNTGNYSSPFLTTASATVSVSNSFTYSTSIYLGSLHKGRSNIKEPNGTYERPNTDRFFGLLKDYTPTQNGTISIAMKRAAFGVKFIADNLSEGKLIISMTEAPQMTIAYGKSTETQDIFTFKHIESYDSSWIADNYTETISVTAVWEKADGVIVPLVTQNIEFKRNKLTTITVRVKENSTDKGVDLITESEQMGDGGKITM